MKSEKRSSSYLGIIVFCALFLVFLIIDIAGNLFGSMESVGGVFKQFAYLGTAALGIILTGRAGGIDLSIGMQLSLVTIIIAFFAAQGSLFAGILVALAVCLAIGAVNGLLISFFKLPALFVTIITGVAARALGILVSGDSGVISMLNVSIMNDLVYFLIFIAALVAAFLLVFFTALGKPFAERTEPGKGERNLYLFTYIISAAFAFLAGLLMAYRLNTGIITAGAGMEVLFIFVLFLAGTSEYFDNRIAPVPVAVFGCFFLTLFMSSFNILQGSAGVVFLFQAVIAIAALFLDRVYRKNIFSFKAVSGTKS